MEATSVLDRLCSVEAIRLEQDPIGTSSALTRMMLYEVPTPWTSALYTQDGTVQQRIHALRIDYFTRLRESGNADRIVANGYPALYGIAPDPEWSSPDRRRVLLITRPAGLMAEFQIAEYFFPYEAPELVAMAQAFFDCPEQLSAFEPFRNHDYVQQRELLVCTHGHVDICCARFGVPLYRQARAAYPKVRAWRCTHFGGHRFAPTAWEFPSGYKWAFLDAESMDHIICQDGDAADLALKVRGWSGVPTQAQVLDREGLNRFGWDWLRFRRRAEMLSDVTADEGPWTVRMHYESPEGIRGCLHGTVGVRRSLPTIGCGPNWGVTHGDMNELCLESLIER